MPTDATNTANSYRRPAAHHETTHTLEIKRSKFITFITRIETVTWPAPFRRCTEGR